MAQKSLTKRIIILGTLASLLLAFFLTGNLAFAADDPLNEQGLQSSGLLYMLAFIGAKFVSWGGALVNWSLNLNSQLLDSYILKAGWPISRDIANLGFVLAIILIAFATILRVPSYRMQQTLVKLIAAALLVNFSLVIAGVFIDFSGVLTNFFINKTTDPNQLATVLANALKIQNQLGSPPDTTALEKFVGFITGSWGRGVLEFTANLFFVLFFTALAAISMLGLAVMLYIRYLVLTILLILMPIAWLLWIWPGTQGNWSKWWQEFFRWAWFAPALSFFIYLAIALTERAAGDPSMNIGASFGAETFSFAAAGYTIGQMISVIGILVGGMIAANSMGIYGAGMTIGAAKGFKNMVTGTITGGAAGLGRLARTKALTAGAGVDKEGKPIQSYAQRLSTALSKGTLAGIPLPGLKTAGAAIGRLSVARKEEVGKYQKDVLGGLTNEALINRANSPTAFINPMESAAMANELAKRNLTEKLSADPKANDTRIAEFMKSASKMGVEKDILKARPDLASKINMDTGKVVSGLRAKEADDISPKALENLEVLLSLSENHIEQIVKMGTNEQKAAIAKGIMSEKARASINQIPDLDERNRKMERYSSSKNYIASNPRFQPFLPKETKAIEL